MSSCASRLGSRSISSAMVPSRLPSGIISRTNPAAPAAASTMALGRWSTPAPEQPAADRQHDRPGRLQPQADPPEQRPLLERAQFQVADGELARRLAQADRQFHLPGVAREFEILDIPSGRMGAAQAGQPLGRAEMCPLHVAVGHQRDLADAKADPRAGDRVTGDGGREAKGVRAVGAELPDLAQPDPSRRIGVAQPEHAVCHGQAGARALDLPPGRRRCLGRRAVRCRARLDGGEARIEWPRHLHRLEAPQMGEHQQCRQGQQHGRTDPDRRHAVDRGRPGHRRRLCSHQVRPTSRPYRCRVHIPLDRRGRRRSLPAGSPAPAMTLAGDR